MTDSAEASSVETDFVLSDSRSVKNHAPETSSDEPFPNAITPDEDRAVKNHTFLSEDGIHPGRNEAENNHTHFLG